MSEFVEEKTQDLSGAALLSDNSDAIAELLVDLIARWTPENETDPED